VHQLLQFTVKLSEHPTGKVRGSLLSMILGSCFSRGPFSFVLIQVLLWRMEFTRILRKLLQNCSRSSFSDDNQTFGRAPSKNDLILKWRIPLFKSIAYVFSIDTSNNEKAVIEE